MARLFFTLLLALLFSIVASLAVPDTAGLPKCILDNCSFDNFICNSPRLQCADACSSIDSSAATSWLLSICARPGVLAQRSENETALNVTTMPVANPDTQTGSGRMSHIAFMMAVFWSSLGCFVIVVIIFEVLGRPSSKETRAESGNGSRSGSEGAAGEEKQGGGE